MMPQSNTNTTMPVLALRGLTIFPNMLLHFDVGRGTSIKALDFAMTEGVPIFLVALSPMSSRFCACLAIMSGSWWREVPGGGSSI